MSSSSLEISQNLAHLLEKMGISEASLGRETDIPRATINRVVSGKTPDPRASTLEAIARYFDISVEQLMGKTPLFNEKGELLRRTKKNSIPVIPWAKAKDQKKIRVSNSTHFILVDSILHEGCFGIEFQGESMWPRFQSNTLLIVDPSRTPKNSDFVIVSKYDSDEVLFRQITIENNYQFLKPINPTFPTLPLEKNDNIIGVVVQARNNFE